MNANSAKQIIKSVNRHIKKERFFEGGRQYGVDYPTWASCYPQLAKLIRNMGEIIMGRPGLYMPKFNY